MARFAKRTEWDLAPNRWAAALVRHGGPPAFDLTLSNPTVAGWDGDPGLLEALTDPRGLRYEPHPLGLPAAREAIAGYYAERGFVVNPDHILLTAGTSEAYAHLFRLLCDPGDRVHVPRPSYPLLNLLAEIHDVDLAPYPLWYENGWHLDVEELRRGFSPHSRAIVAIEPNNPTGSYFQPEEQRALADCATARGLATIIDEVFYDYRWNDHAGSRPPGLKGTESEAAALRFTLNGLSKLCALPQMKLAWMIVSGPEPERTTALSRLELINDSYLSVATPVQWALPRLLAQRHAIQARVRERVRANLAELDRRLELSPSPVSRLRAEGGWVAVLRLPETRSDEEWAERFLTEAGVLVHPGSLYHFASNAYAVISLLPPEQGFREGVERILDCVAGSVEDSSGGRTLKKPGPL